MLKRPTQSMSEDVRAALVARGLLNAYAARPAYQRNDYLAWIERAKRTETRAKRLGQMLAELDAGGVYMNMKHAASAKD